MYKTCNRIKPYDNDTSEHHSVELQVISQSIFITSLSLYLSHLSVYIYHISQSIFITSLSLYLSLVKDKKILKFLSVTIITAFGGLATLVVRVLIHLQCTRASCFFLSICSSLWVYVSFVFLQLV